ncbi:hypothetical protein BHM03_00038802 [Ensete ventricosum]|nr:hypothetical protein BHM03_00038802 [Ensete ventricosum]
MASVPLPFPAAASSTEATMSRSTITLWPGQIVPIAARSARRLPSVGGYSIYFPPALGTDSSNFSMLGDDTHLSLQHISSKFAIVSALNL